jgi:hypothetical protein
MINKQNTYFMSFFTLLTLIASIATMSFVFMKGENQVVHAATSGNLPSKITSSAAQAIDTGLIPQSLNTAATTGKSRPLPLLTGHSPAVYAKLKAQAAHNTNAPKAPNMYSQPSKSGTYTPAANQSFQGMANSASTCPYFGGCQPPDMALAASPSWVFQGVNTSFSVYSTKGVKQSGWPKTAQKFFGVPNPGTCDTHGPFLSDPRAFYDINDGRFWAATLQVEGAFGLNSCTFQTKYWIAYSLTNSPSGKWCSYSFDMSAGTTNAADYTQFGFDGQDVYFSGNMFDQSGSIYNYAEAYSFTKPVKGSTSCARSLTSYGFTNLTTPDGVLADTVQPVMAETTSNNTPRGGLFISSYNINSGGGECSSVCNGVVVWAFANPGTPGVSLSEYETSTTNYELAPNADEPGCSYCIETLDTRISATPVYRNGLITFALETGANNGAQVVPSIFWGQVTPSLDDTGHLTNLSVSQSGYLTYGGDGSASFGALMPDLENNLFMVFDYMDSSSNPEVTYVARRSTLQPGTFHDNGIVLRQGDAPTIDSRWGDFEAASYDGLATDNVWFAGQYSTSNGDWSTYIGSDHFCTSCNIAQ